MRRPSLSHDAIAYPYIENETPFFKVTMLLAAHGHHRQCVKLTGSTQPDF